MNKILVLLSLLFLSSCSFSGNKGQIKNQVTNCWNVKDFDKKYSDSRVILHLNLNKDGSIDKTSVLKSICGKLNKEECDQFVNSAIEAVYKSSPIKHLFIDQYEDWKEFDLLFDPSHIFEQS